MIVREISENDIKTETVYYVACVNCFDKLEIKLMDAVLHRANTEGWRVVNDKIYCGKCARKLRLLKNKNTKFNLDGVMKYKIGDGMGIVADKVSFIFEENESYFTDGFILVSGKDNVGRVAENNLDYFIQNGIVRIKNGDKGEQKIFSPSKISLKIISDFLVNVINNNQVDIVINKVEYAEGSKYFIIKDIVGEKNLFEIDKLVFVLKNIEYDDVVIRYDGSIPIMVFMKGANCISYLAGMRYSNLDLNDVINDVIMDKNTKKVDITAEVLLK
jgi:hypothetical protein